MARKKAGKSPDTSDESDLDWLREAHADAIDDNVKLAEENAELRRESAHLTEEVFRLRSQLEAQGSTAQKASTSAATPPIAPTQSKSLSSLPSEKSTSTVPTASRESVQVPPPTTNRVAVFRSFFRGREDVFAKRWESQQKGTAGYVPACVKEWKRPHCTKPQKKCTECVYSPMTEDIIAAHLAGHLTVGVYPMLPDDRCWFLAADFDGDEWQRDAVAYLRTCSNLKVPAYLERSRSGNGGHVWIFLEIPILASDARKLGAAILTKTMEERHEIKFTTYDRFFPNQDTMPHGGFGNLIALPLNGRSARAGNSLFIDENLQPYADQWDFLKTVQGCLPSTSNPWSVLPSAMAPWWVSASA